VSHQDKDRRSAVYNFEYLEQALYWLLRPVDWKSIRFRDDCSWQPVQLAVAALLWVWSDELTLRLFIDGLPTDITTSTGAQVTFHRHCRATRVNSKVD